MTLYYHDEQAGITIYCGAKNRAESTNFGYNGCIQQNAPGSGGTLRGLTPEGLVPMCTHDTPAPIQETREERRKRLDRERAARYRARLRGEDVATRRPGPYEGFQQSPEHVAKRKMWGASNPHWKGDNISVHSGRSRALRAYPVIGPCHDCGAEKTERHHVDGNTANNDPSNIMPLCRRCHVRRHRQGGKA